MTDQNPILRHSPSAFYSGDALKAAEAIRGGELAALEALLKKVPEVASNEGGKNLPMLVWAMGHRNVRAFEILLKAGAAPDVTFKIGDVAVSLLSAATGAQQPDFFNLLLKHRVNPNGMPETEPPLFTAIKSDKHDRFEMLLGAGADLNHRDDTGSTVLLQLAFQNDYKRALTLVRRGADVNVEMVNGTSLRLLIERYPLPPASPQGMAQAEMKRLLR